MSQFVTFSYCMDLEQIMIKDVAEYKAKNLSVAWPPKFWVDLTHWWGETADPLLLARPTWYETTIWWDVIWFGPFYLMAIYAFTFGKEWIRIPALIYGVSPSTHF